MSIKESDRLEKILKKRFEDHQIDGGRDLFPAIAEKLERERHKRNSRYRYMLAASVVLVIMIGAITFINFHQRPPVFSTAEVHFEQPLPPQPLAKSEKDLIGEKNTEPRSTPKPERIATITKQAAQRGEKVVMPDGSIIILEDESSIEYNTGFGKSDRSVYLKGTAFFEVAKTKNLPFVVSTDHSLTTVLGTSFTIQSSIENKRDKITVFTGLVSFTHKDTRQTLKLEPGSSAALSSDHIQFTEYHTNARAWQTNRLEFDETPMKEVMDDLEAYYGKRIITADSSLINCTFSGLFTNPEINELLSILSLSLNIDYEITSDQIIFSGKGRGTL